MEEAFPGQPGDKPHREEEVPAEARRKRVLRYVKFDAAREAKMLRPGAADEVYRSPEERLARLDCLISHYVGLAYEQWLRVEKTMDD